MLGKLMMWEQWMKSDTISKTHATRARKKFRYLMYCIRKTAPRRKGMRWKILKFHAIIHMAEDILRFGVPKNFDTEADEVGHKPSKKPRVLCKKIKRSLMSRSRYGYWKSMFWTSRMKSTQMAGQLWAIITKPVCNLWHQMRTKRQQH